MTHEETVRLVPGAKTAVLFMHGIAGTPEHFRKEILPLEQLVLENWSVYNVLMDGHGGQVDDFAKTSMKKWKEQVFRIFHQLCESHEKVIVAGHSMGTLFAIQMALEAPEKIPYLFLVDCPLRVGVKPFGVCNLIKLSFGLLDPEDPVQAATGKVSSITQTWQSWRYIGWLPRLYELISEMHSTARLVHQLPVKCVCFQSKCDELVSCRTCRILKDSGKVQVRCLRHSTHFYYADEDISAVQKCWLRLMKTAGSD